MRNELPSKYRFGFKNKLRDGVRNATRLNLRLDGESAKCFERIRMDLSDIKFYLNTVGSRAASSC